MTPLPDERDAERVAYLLANLSAPNLAALLADHEVMASAAVAERDRLKAALESIRHYLDVEGRPLVDRIHVRIDEALGAREAKP